MHNLKQLTFSLCAKYRRRLFRQIVSHGRFKCTTTFDNPPDMMPAPPLTVPLGVVGQPTCHTHPHLIPHGHLTCGITQAEYKERRSILVGKLSEETSNPHRTHIIVIPAARKQYMSDKIPYVFRQNSDFFYLTGCMEPSAVLVLMKPAQTDNYKSIIFVHEKDSHAELWEGPRTGCNLAAPLFAVDEAYPVESFNNFIHKASASSRPAVLWYHNECPANPDIHNTVCSVLRQGQVALEDPQRNLHMMRVIKSEAEIELMKETCFIGSQAMNMAMACTKPGPMTIHLYDTHNLIVRIGYLLQTRELLNGEQHGMSEHTVSAVHEFACRQGGAEHGAFPPVVAGGERATHIHYVANNQLLAEHEMLLVDAGSQRWLYNSDISRTWPVSGRFSKYHRILYELVLSVQKRLIELVGEQRPALDQLFEHMCRLLGAQLQREGVLPRDIDSNDLIGKAYRLCPHHVSHYLGLDVHDAPLVRRRTPVRAGMVVTVEPGIYIRPDDDSVPEEFRGLGIRIEDDVLITDGEPLVLTDACVKEVSDIEALVGKQSL